MSLLGDTVLVQHIGSPTAVSADAKVGLDHCEPRQSTTLELQFQFLQPFLRRHSPIRPSHSAHHQRLPSPEDILLVSVGAFGHELKI